MDKIEPTPEHQWLHQFVGEWTGTGSMPAGAAGEGNDCPPWTVEETVRSIGGLWIQAEGRGKGPDGSPSLTQLTLGYDRKKQRIVGTWLGSMMDYLWVYEGELDAAGKVLTLHTEGPDCIGTRPTARYREVIELRGANERSFSSHVQGDDGQWKLLMECRYQRKT
ncbi:MAG: DUF1579 domain-containing protein [Aquabacterium sp.]|nr:MAG: DUF1579 domain-containing protein [Aquabacterium sp.]